MQAMILAAGFGTRLLPYTKLRPKPLFPLLNEPLLLLTIRRLQAAGFDHIVVNCHYLKEQIVTALDGVSGVFIQEEEMVLGTGGGLRLALSHLRDEPLLVTNGDIYHAVDFQELYASHLKHDGAVTMAMHDYPRFNKVRVEGDLVTGFDGTQGGTPLAFTGLHVLEPEVLNKIPVAISYSIIDRYKELLREGKTIQALRVDGCSWTDMGTVEDYLDLHRKLLQKEIPLWHEFESVPETAICVHKKASIGRGTELLDWVCVGDARVDEDVHIQRCIVWDGACVDSEHEYCDSLLVPHSQ